MWLLVLSSVGVVTGENIDPDNDGSQYAWAENVGWLNAEPAGDPSPGVQVDDFELTGWMWGENIGWVSLSCKNRDSCDAVEYGVRNDGQGVLVGHAWAENVGWIDFSPANAGVSIDPATGDFSGHAWGENIGWIAFSSVGPNPYRMKTSWRCEPPPLTPAGSPHLTIGQSGPETRLQWSGLTDATAYDVVYGYLSLLRPDGDFGSATAGCLSDDLTSTTTVFLDLPPADEGYWFLVRGVNCGGNGTYDSGGPAQADARDEGINTAAPACP